MGALALVTVDGGDALSLVERGRRLLKLADLGHCGTEAGVKPRERGVVARQERGRADQQIHGGERVAAVMRSTTGRLEMAGRPSRQRARLGFGGPQFAQIANGLFEVVAEDLRALGGRFPEHVLEPVGEAVVQFGAK